MIFDKITNKLPWRIQSYFGYRPIKSITARGYFKNKVSSPHLDSEFLSEVLPEGHLNLSKAISINQNEHPHFEEISEKPYDECLFFSLKHAKYTQHTLVPTVIDQKNRLISDANKDPNKKRTLHPIFTVKKLNPAKQLKGRTLLLSTDGGHNGFFHWLCRIMPKLWVLEEFNISTNDFDHIIVNGPELGFKKQLIDIFEIPQEKVIFSENYEVFLCNHLFVINNIRYHKKGIRFVKNKVLNHSAPNVGDGFKKIYVSRDKARFRKILNPEILDDFLEQNNFKIIFLEDYSIVEQAHIINSAEIIISVHGAGLSNIIFKESSCKLIEIYPESYVNINYWFYANLMNIKYYYYIGKTPKEQLDNRMNTHDIIIDESLIERLDHLLTN